MVYSKNMADIGIFYGSTTGNTQEVAEKIQAGFGPGAADLYPIADASADVLNTYPYLALGASTWGVGELQDDWIEGLAKLDKVDWSDKKVALFGTGDPQGYPDSFVDALGILYEKLAAKGAEIIGFWPTAGYEYEASRAEQEGRFVGLVIDEDNQSELTDERISRWLDDLKAVVQ